MRREYQGAAQSARLSVSLGGTTGDLTIYCDDLSNWPTGTSGRPFYVVIDRNTSAEEKILCASRSGNVLTVYNVGGNNGRGADDTSITAHSNNAVIEHVFTATDADEANAHVNDTTTDVHPQYILKSVANAKGDLLVATANDTWSRVGVGTNGQYLVADSAETPGVKWAGLPAPVPYAIAAMDTSFSFAPFPLPPLQDGLTGTIGTVTFPTGRFTETPICSVIPRFTGDSLSVTVMFAVYSISTSSVTLFVSNNGPRASVSGGGNLNSARANIIAVQMTSGSGAG